MERNDQTDLLPNLILQHMPEAVITVDKKWAVSFMNPAAEILTGWTLKAALERNLGEILTLLDADTSEEIKIPSMRAFSRDSVPVVYWNLAMSSTDGNKTPVDAVFTAMKNIHGSATGCLLILTNVSVRNKHEKEFLNRQKIEAIANMAGSLAHDFSNSLAMISGHASSISDNLIPKTRAHEESLRILEAAKRAGNIAKRLISISRIGAVKTNMKIETVALGAIVKEAIKMAEESFESQKISFKIRNLENMPSIMADDRQLLDCLLNLILNSLDAMPDGGTITIDAGEITLRKINYTILRVRDTGCGMSKDVLLHAFEPFFTTKPAGAGAGLGLTVVQSSLGRWGGFVKIRSRPKQGTSVRLFLRKARIQPAREPSRGTKSGLESILIIDDSKALLEKNAAILKNAGYKVHSASCGEEGLQLYKKYADEINLSIIDLIMPGTGGKEILGEILAANPTAQIIMTSGFSRDYVRTSLERGAWGFIQKPFSSDHLLTAVRKILDQESAAKAE